VVVVLRFCKGECFTALLKPGLNTRAVLLSDEKRDRSAPATAIRKNRAVISAWKWDPLAKTGTFWLDEEVTRQWKGQQWAETILRMNLW
jgi:hypothetical protein